MSTATAAKSAAKSAAVKTGTTDSVVSSAPAGRSKPRSRFASAIAAGEAMAEKLETGAQVVEGTATVGQCKWTQPKAIGATGIATVPAYDLDKDRPVGDVTQDDLRDSCRNSCLAGAHRVTVIKAEDETEAAGTRPGVFDSDKEAVANANLVSRATGGRKPSGEDYDLYLPRKAAGLAARKG